jgi:hypothetical protein
MCTDEAALLIGREHDAAPLLVRIAERCEDAPADAEIRVPVVRLFGRLLEGERDAPESGGCHVRMIGSPPGCVKSTAARHRDE